MSRGTSRLIVTLLIAVYFALGTPTKRWGVKDVVAYHMSHRSPATFATGIGDVEFVAPLLIRVEPFQMAEDQYYFWFFGFVLHVADGPTARESHPGFR